MNGKRLIVLGGGAAGFFTAIRAAELDATLQVMLVEKAAQFLGKVRISGGGRCNVTHAEFDPRRFIENYPRGAKELLGPLHRFQARDTVDWFAHRGVTLKTEADGRMFPSTDSSQTIVECLLQAAADAGVTLRNRCDVVAVRRAEAGGFRVQLKSGEELVSDALALATGGSRATAGARIAESLGHTLVPAVPSLFAFDLDAAWLHGLAGVSLKDVAVSLPGTKLASRGPVVVTHKGLSGPAILRLSAWGARDLHAADYTGALQVNWVPGRDIESMRRQLERQARSGSRRSVGRSALFGIPARLWTSMTGLAGIGPDVRWQALSRVHSNALLELLHAMQLPIRGKSTNKEEFVTCGGIALREVDFRSMESRVCPGLFLAGEILDIDALTGGFNFQSAWTTGWLAGTSCAGRKADPAGRS